MMRAETPFESSCRSNAATICREDHRRSPAERFDTTDQPATNHLRHAGYRSVELLTAEALWCNSDRQTGYRLLDANR